MAPLNANFGEPWVACRGTHGVIAHNRANCYNGAPVGLYRIVVFVSLAVGGCTVSDPLFCATDDDCGTGLLCDTDGDGQRAGGNTHTCVNATPDPVNAPCGGPDETTLAQYDFESPDLVSGFENTVDNRFPADVEETVGQTEGPPPCARAPGGDTNMALLLTGQGYGVIQNHEAWEDLAEGAVELWLNPKEPKDSELPGVFLSRDARDKVQPGHMTLGMTKTGRVFAKLQQNGGTHYGCSDALTYGSWVHVGYNFGGTGAGLYINGVKQQFEGEFFTGEGSKTCSASPPPPGGIAGNMNPWIIGASGAWSMEGMADDIQRKFEGAIDRVRFSQTPQDFAAINGR